MKDVNDIKIAVGFSIAHTRRDNDAKLNKIKKHRSNVYDIHFAHYDPNIMASGRFSKNNNKEQTFYVIERALQNNIKATLLMNYMYHNDYDLIIRDFKENFYPRGIRSVVIADIELIKRMKQTFPDVHIQGSCLSYRMTEDELYEEAIEGVEIHNPAVDIIRDYNQLIANHKAGFKQKVIFSEGCIHRCPHERSYKGHRWHISRNLNWHDTSNCTTMIGKDMRYFYLANWVTIERLKELSDYIDVIKLPRMRDYDINNDVNLTSDCGDPYLFHLDMLIDLYSKDNASYNILELNGVMSGRYLSQKYFNIPSTYFDSDFFNKAGYCGMRCKELNCSKCFKIHKRIVDNYSRD